MSGSAAGETRPLLSPSVVDVVSCSLDMARTEIDALRGYLSADECGRADRFLVERARDHFVVARGRLRQVLGALCACAPSAIRFSVADGGKPGLEDGGDGRIRFNVAHSNDLMTCAITLDHEVGIDLEHVRDDTNHEDIARRFFSPDEVRSLAALPRSILRDAFYACWTRKEAVVKATGEGLARVLTSFVVSVDPGDARMLAADPALGRPDEWSLIALPVPPGYQGAVAVRAPVSLRTWSWPVAWAG